MSDIIVWKVKKGCRTCKSPTFYRQTDIPLIRFEELSINKPKNRDIYCTCSGEIGNVKHTLNYSFPTDFEHAD